jgi:hypothetical protein
MMTHADIFAVGHAIEMPDGKTYTLRSPTQIEQGEFQRWLEERTHAAVDRASASEEQKDRRHAQIDDKAALGYYEWDGPLGIQARWMPAGMTKAIEIICRDQGVDHKRAEEIARHHIRTAAAVILKGAAKDPKAWGPILEAMGLPASWFASAPSEHSSSFCSTHPSTEASRNSETAPTTSSCSSTNASEPPKAT